jgi:hypothetical protein
LVQPGAYKKSDTARRHSFFILLLLAWQQALSGWRNANSEIAQLESVVTNLQKHVEELQAETTSMDVAEPSGPATPISSSNKESEYQTDKEELAKGTEWIRVKQGAKKRKINDTHSLSKSADPQKIIQLKLSLKSKGNQLHPNYGAWRKII